MNHKEGDKGLGTPKGKMTNDQILQWYLPKKIWNFKLAIIQAAGKTSSGGNTGYWTTFSVNNSEGLWDLRKGQSRFGWWKTRASGGVGTLCHMMMMILSTKRRTQGLWVSGDRRPKLSWRRWGGNIIRMIYSGLRKRKSDN